jgi:hypothetical protein
VHNLRSKNAVRFKFRQCDEQAPPNYLRKEGITYLTDDEICSLWSDYKVLATTVSKDFQENEYSDVEIRGTGLNNHNYSYVKVDDNFLLKHAYYQGFWLFVLDRRNL